MQLAEISCLHGLLWDSRCSHNEWERQELCSSWGGWVVLSPQRDLGCWAGWVQPQLVMCEGAVLLEDEACLCLAWDFTHHRNGWESFLRQWCFEKSNLKADTQQQLAGDGMVFISQKGTFWKGGREVCGCGWATTVPGCLLRTMVCVTVSFYALENYFWEDECF